MLARLTMCVIFAFGLVGCENDCQRMCYEVAELFDQCDQDYDQGEVNQCLDDYSDPSEADLLVCQDARGNLAELLEYKSDSGEVCDELSQYGGE